MEVQTLEDAIQSTANHEELLRTLRPGSDSGHLRLFKDVPDEFTNWREEQLAWKEGCALSDLSHHMYDLHVEGSDAIDVFKDLGINSFQHFEPGQAKQFAACNADGYLIGDGILFYLSENNFNLVGYSAINWVRYHLERGSYDASYVVNSHGGVRSGPPLDFRYQIQGPHALRVVKKAVDEPLPDIPFFNFREILIAGKEAYALRHGMMDEPGFELFGPWEHADTIRSRILEVGKEYGIRAVGAKAYPTNVIPNAWIPIPVPAIFGERETPYREWLDAGSFEGAFTVGGSYRPASIDQYYLTPFEAGHGRFIDFDREFIGKSALEEQQDQPQRKKVTLVWNGEAVSEMVGSLFTGSHTPRYLELPTPNWALSMYDAVTSDGNEVGVSIAPRYLYFERSMFSIGIVNESHAEPGTEVIIRWGESGPSPNPRVEDHEQTEILATVAPTPYYEDKRKTTDYSAI